MNSMKFEQLILEKYLKPALINANPNVNVHVDTDLHPLKQEQKTTNKLLRDIARKMGTGNGFKFARRYDA